jgi:hypothetical protein
MRLLAVEVTIFSDDIPWLCILRIRYSTNLKIGQFMMKKILNFATVTMVMASTCLSSNVNAATSIGNSLIALNPTLGWGEAAQSFTVPTTDNILSQWTFALDGSGANYKFSIVEMNGGIPDVTQSLFSVTNPWGTGSQVINGINLALTPGAQYAAVIDFLGYTDISVLYGGDGYSDGNGFWGDVSGGNFWNSFSDLDLNFSAEFVSRTNVPEPASIALLGLGFAGILLARRRKA